jgi:ABC-type polysaccharide/polyol phosphate transport system ATPase subunit
VNGPAISLEGVGKAFRVPLDHSTTLKYRLTHWRSAGRFRTLHALDNISFDVPHGQFLGVIGHNGCGKSTLLKILSKIYQPDSGTANVDGRVSPFLELGVGFNPELTARENVFLNGALLGLSRATLRDRVDEIIAFAEVEDFADQKLKNFSSGMQVRLAFSVAIQADAGILLMDEVLAVGDARFQEKCFEVFARYKRDGRTVVLVTHDLVSVERYCDRAILLDHGRLVEDGHPTDVTARYRRMVAELAERKPVEEPVDPAKNRDGSGEVVVTAVRLRDGHGSERHTFHTGTELLIEIEYGSHEIVGDLGLQLSVLRSDGLQMAVVDTASAGLVLPCPVPGDRALVQYAIATLNLLEASYHVGLALMDIAGVHTFDRMVYATGFRTVDDRTRQGLVDLGGKWRLLNAGIGATSPAEVPAVSISNPA